MVKLTPEQCKNFWKAADKNGDGEVTIQELKQAICQTQQISDTDIAKMFCDIDKSGDGRISWDEFSREMMELEGRAEGLIRLFKTYDKSGDGNLSADELKDLIRNCGQYKNPEAVAKSIIDACDKDGDGQISFAEFKKAVN